MNKRYILHENNVLTDGGRGQNKETFREVR